MSAKLDTHTYDGKIATLLPQLHDIQNLSLEEKKTRVEPLTKLPLSAEAQHYLQGIIAAFGSGQNIDPTNSLNADDLLCACVPFKDNEDFRKQFNEQLCDMRTGFCPQGRTHRLFQLVQAFSD